MTAGDVATVTIEDRSYSYTVQSGDTLDSVRDTLIALINQDPKVTAEAAGVYDRIIIKARVEGPEGNGIPISGSANSSATVIITAFSTSLCCANVAGGLVTPENPAIPGETIIVYATGLGLPVLNDQVAAALQTGCAVPLGRARDGCRKARCPRSPADQDRGRDFRDTDAGHRRHVQGGSPPEYHLCRRIPRRS